LHKLGDSIFTIPAIMEIVKYYKKNIYIVCFSETKQIFQEVLPDLNYIYLNFSDFSLSGRIASRKARKSIKQKKPKTLFDLTSSIKSASLIFNSEAEEIIGANEQHFKNIYSHFTPVRNKPHIIDIYLDIVKTKISFHDNRVRRTFPIKIFNNRRILIQPFAGWRSKEWNLLKYVRLGEKLKQEFDVTLIAPINTLSSEIKNEINNNDITIIETETIPDLIKQIKECSVFVGNDSGPTYIANLLGKATFTIFGPTNPEYHLPFGNYHKFIQMDIDCVPKDNDKLCFTNGGRVGCPSFECMNQLSVDNVYKNLLKFLGEIKLVSVN
jgi:ADP-heptose:LPS heptosyltransferase